MLEDQFFRELEDVLKYPKLKGHFSRCMFLLKLKGAFMYFVFCLLINRIKTIISRAQSAWSESWTFNFTFNVCFALCCLLSCGCRNPHGDSSVEPEQQIAFLQYKHFFKGSTLNTSSSLFCAALSSLSTETQFFFLLIDQIQPVTQRRRSLLWC